MLMPPANGFNMRRSLYHFNGRRYPDRLNNLTPEEVWLGRGPFVLDHRRKIKEKSLQLRKQVYFERKTA
jgi:hypothetical protein